MEEIPFLKKYDSKASRLLYHYTSALTGIDKILASGEIRFSPISETNDPRENRDWSFIALSDYENEHDFHDHDEVELSLNVAAKRHSKIACFSLDNEKQAPMFPDDILYRGFARSRMWSQYGESHRGMCFVFSADVLAEAVTQHVESDSFVIASKVRYTDNVGELLRGQSFDWGEVEHVGFTEYARAYIKKHAQAIFFLKVKDYRDEQEFRIAVHGGSSGYLYVPFDSALRAVILGVDFPLGLIPAARYFCGQRNVPLVMLNWKFGRPHLSAPFEALP